MNGTKSNFYDSTFYDTIKSKISKPTELSISPQNISTVVKTKPKLEVVYLNKSLKNL